MRPTEGPLPELPDSYAFDQLGEVCKLLGLNPANVAHLHLTPDRVTVARIRLGSDGVTQVVERVPVRRTHDKDHSSTP